MRKVNAFKIHFLKEEVHISFRREDPGLEYVYGQKRLCSKLVLSMDTIAVLRQEMQVHHNVSSMFFLERTIRKSNGIEQLMSTIRKRKLKYKISAHTHC